MKQRPEPENLQSLWSLAVAVGLVAAAFVSSNAAQRRPPVEASRVLAGEEAKPPSEFKAEPVLEPVLEPAGHLDSR